MPVLEITVATAILTYLFLCTLAFRQGERKQGGFTYPRLTFVFIILSLWFFLPGKILDAAVASFKR